MNLSDQLLAEYYSPEIESIRKKAWNALRFSIISGIAAVLLFGGFVVIVFGAVLSASNPLANPLTLTFLLTGIPTLIALIPTSWFFSLRHIYLLNQAKSLIDARMKTAVQSPPPLPPA